MAAKSFRPPSEKENEEAQEDPKPQAGGIKKKRKDMEASDPLPITNEASSSLGRSILLLPVTVPTILQKEKQPRKRRRTAESSEEKEQTKQLEEEKEDCVDIAKRFKCAVPGCGMSFIKQFKLERHMRTHDKKRPFHCLWPGCAMSFSRKDHLKRHQLIHTDARDYKCTHPGCAHAFNTNRKLRRHLKMHENPLPYVCTHTQCQAKFAKKNQLRSHECEAHDGGLPFRCSSDGCSMKFRTQSELRRHRNIEHGAKRYFCDGAGCGEAFVRFLEFQAHRRHFHPELFTYPCKDCGEIFTSKTQLGKHAVSHKKGLTFVVQ